QKAVDLSQVQVLVLDEADRMLDMGFLPSVRRIVEATPKSRQTLLFSATIDKGVLDQVDAMLDDPAIVQIAAKGETADTVEQYIAHVPHTLKPDLLAALLKERGHKRVIVFARTRHRADAACRKLKRAGYHAEAIHSDRSQNQRKRALDNFASGETDILVATDVLARGIDVDEVSYVVNYDVPTQAEDYVHRIGRTGRAGPRASRSPSSAPRTKTSWRPSKLIKRDIPRSRSRASTGRGRRGRSRARHAGQCPTRPRAGSGRRGSPRGRSAAPGEGACRAGCRRVAPARHAQEAGRQAPAPRTARGRAGRDLRRLRNQRPRAATARRRVPRRQAARRVRRATSARSRPSRCRRQAQRRQAPRLKHLRHKFSVGATLVAPV
ncbi:MAG: DEAD/DEAH box helicase, partial [Coriobacteriaceae bacterium]